MAYKFPTLVAPDKAIMKPDPIMIALLTFYIYPHKGFLRWDCGNPWDWDLSWDSFPKKYVFFCAKSFPPSELVNLRLFNKVRILIRGISDQLTLVWPAMRESGFLNFTPKCIWPAAAKFVPQFKISETRNRIAPK